MHALPFHLCYVRPCDQRLLAFVARTPTGSLPKFSLSLFSRPLSLCRFETREQAWSTRFDPRRSLRSSPAVNAMLHLLQICLPNKPHVKTATVEEMVAGKGMGFIFWMWSGQSIYSRVPHSENRFFASITSSPGITNHFLNV